MKLSSVNGCALVQKWRSNMAFQSPKMACPEMPAAFVIRHRPYGSVRGIRRLCGIAGIALLSLLAHAQDAVAKDAVTWQQIPGAAKDIGAGGGKVWVIGVNPNPPAGDAIYRWTDGTTGNPWEQIPGAAVRIAVDGRGNAWAVNGLHDIYRFDGKTWQQIPGAAKDIGAGGGKVWVIGVNPNPPAGDAIYRWTGGTTGNPWEQIPGAAVRIAVDDSGNAWVVNGLNNIYRFDGKAWQQIPGAAKDIGAGGGKVWVIGVNPNPPAGDAIYRWTGEATGNPWEQVPGAGTQITADDKGNPWVVNGLNNIYRGIVEPTGEVVHVKRGESDDESDDDSGDDDSDDDSDE